MVFYGGRAEKCRIANGLTTPIKPRPAWERAGFSRDSWGGAWRREQIPAPLPAFPDKREARRCETRGVPDGPWVPDRRRLRRLVREGRSKIGRAHVRTPGP